MNKRQSNKYYMYVNVSGILKKNSSVFRSVPAYRDTIAMYFGLLEELLEVEARIEKGSKPATEAKKKARIALANKAGLVSSSVSFYAYDTGKTGLINDVSYSFTSLIRAREAVFISIMHLISSACEEHRQDLENYHLSGELIAEFKNEIVAYRNLARHAGAVRSGLAADYQRSRDLFNEIDHILNAKVDKMMWKMKMKHPELFVSYRAARSIVDYR